MGAVSAVGDALDSVLGGVGDAISGIAGGIGDAVSGISKAVSDNPVMSLALAAATMDPEFLMADAAATSELGGLDALGNVIGSTGSEIGAANSLADFSAPDLYQPMTRDEFLHSTLADASSTMSDAGSGYDLGNKYEIPQIKISSDPTKFVTAGDMPLEPVNYSLGTAKVGNPAAIGDAAIKLSSQPGIQAMGGAQGLTIPATGAEGVAGTLGAGGFTPLNSVPSLGDPKSFINTPEGTTRPGWQDALKTVGSLLGEIGGIPSGGRPTGKGGLGDFGSLKFGESFLPGSSGGQTTGPSMVKLQEQAVIPALMAVLQQRGMTVNQPSYADGGGVDVKPIKDNSYDYLIDTTDPYTQLATTKPASLSSVDYLGQNPNNSSNVLFGTKPAQFGFAYGGSVPRFADGGDTQKIDYSDPHTYIYQAAPVKKPEDKSPLASIQVGGTGKTPTPNPEGAAANAAAMSNIGEAVNSGLQGLGRMLSQPPITFQVLMKTIDAVKNAMQNSQMGKEAAAKALAEANTANGLTADAVAAANAANNNGVANVNQGIAATNAATAQGIANAANNAGADGASSGPGGLAGTTGQAGVTATTAATTGTGPGSSGGLGTGAAMGIGAANGVSAAGAGAAGYADGGKANQKDSPLSHRPEFITGKTGHYAQGRGTGQSDDIPAVLHDGDYVVDADTVAAFGDGSSKAGAGALEQFRRSIPEHHSGGGQPIRAQIADGEYVLPAGFVTSLGRGSNKHGAKMLDAMREQIRAHKRSAPDTKIPPKAKKPAQYLREAMKG